MDESIWHDAEAVDLDALRLSASLSVSQRVARWRAARAFAVALMRARLQRCYPDLSEEQLGLKLLEELARADHLDALI
ncbi:MAG TPA: hypothetical protein DEP84_22015 [Chloroflexi bacterium]|nr:hypothetical protein [Chloroflexota bacterium]